MALRSTWSRWLFHHSLRHLSEQNFFSFRPGICWIAAPQHLQTLPVGASTCVDSFCRLQNDFTVFSEIPNLAATFLYPRPSARRLRMSIFCSFVITIPPSPSLGHWTAPGTKNDKKKESAELLLQTSITNTLLSFRVLF